MIDVPKTLGHRYVACPNCGNGLARNWLNCRDPDWKHCEECAEIIRTKANRNADRKAAGEVEK
jgi:hypothetical protein